MKHLKRLPQYRMPLALTLIMAVLLAGCITLLALWCQPNALRSVLVIFKAQPMLIVLNALPIGLLVLLCTCLFRNVFFGGALTNLAVCLLSIANRVKIEVRDEPVFPRDFALLKEVGVIVGDYEIRYPWTAIGLVVAATLALVVLGLFLKCRPFPIKRLRGWLGSLLGILANGAFLVSLVLTIYASNSLYNSFKTSNPYYVPAVFNELGFPYCFFHQFTTYSVEKPEDFNRAEAQGWENADTDSAEEAKPVNVIMIMNEAFSDITDYEAFGYDETNEPLPNLQAMRADPHAVTGRIVVPNFAAGTANTEFDVMTGIQTNALSPTTTSAFRVVNRKLDSLFRVYGEHGYHTSYFHPGDNWFYNRENVLEWMGAEDTLFIEEMTDVQSKGRWVMDQYLVGLIEKEFEETVGAGDTLFHYTTTIQNHMSYTADKYGAEYVYPEVPLNVAVSPEVETMLKVYIEGARDADAMLGELKNYFSSQEEPVVLVFFGDHLPSLGNNQLGYQELGMTEDVAWDTLISYETPFVIWANDAAADTLDWSAAESLPERISASFLGAAVLELTGHDSSSNWFSFLNELRQEYPVVQGVTALLPEGQEINLHFLDDTPPKILDQWRQWSYYKLKYQEFDS